jgi:polyisoprenoid-binding protein YceI
MKGFSNTIKRGLLGILFSVLPLTAIAEEELCAPFRNGSVDESIVARMLASARDGHLYRIRPASSRVGFCVRSSAGMIKGSFKDFRGGLTFVPTDTRGDGQEALVMVQTESLETSSPLVESMLKSEKFFDVENFPEILFVSRQFRWVSGSEAILIGDLTMHGVTRQVGFHVELIENDASEAGSDQQEILIKATTLISRADFGLGSLPRMVDDHVSLCMSVDAVKYRAL